MTRFVQLQTLGGTTLVAVNPEHVAQASEFDSGRGIGTTLKLVNGDTVNVRGTLAEILEKLGASQ
ncbi:MAG TPA: hypothetical protein VHW00_13345 [Thermoanaerobaculia bacterium]|nr:hypothetical protein [Thermoanaerobaculia bacterium]